MSKEEVEAVLGHEVAHVANGDMVTMTLIQGVVNTFVVFLARIVGTIVDRTVFPHRAGRRAGLLHHRHRVRDRFRAARLAHRHVVLAPARISRRSRFGPVSGLGQADDPRARPSRRPRSRRAATVDPRDGNQRSSGLDGAFFEPSANPGPHRSPASLGALGRNRRDGFSRAWIPPGGASGGNRRTSHARPSRLTPDSMQPSGPRGA